MIDHTRRSAALAGLLVFALAVLPVAPAPAQDETADPGLTVEIAPEASEPDGADRTQIEADILSQVQDQMTPPDTPGQAVEGVPAGIAILNQERLIGQTLYGRRIQRELEAASEALAEENRRIEAQLTEEELDLTELRDTMEAAEFRTLADEFDIRVEAIRAAQEAKARDLQAQADGAQQRFFELAFPILLAIIEDRGAAVLMDSRAVLISAEAVDITAEAIERINADLGEGGEAPLVRGLSPAQPVPRPGPAPDGVAPGADDGADATDE